jgi:DNA (cytosine-5)-methyltransferase 1
MLANIKPIAHVEMNKDACDTLRTRAAYWWLKENKKEEIYYEYLSSENKNKIDLWNKVPSNIIDSVINSEISEVVEVLFVCIFFHSFLARFNV